jgi:DNA mismatch repair ATPase MutS
VRHLDAQPHALSLIATHYRSLTSLWKTKQLGHTTALRHFHVHVPNDGGELIFTHSLRDGPALSSQALYVARQAGVPEELVLDAGNLLGRVEHD